MLLSRLKIILPHIIEVLFPKFCFGCNSEGAYICRNCLTQQISILPSCFYCGALSNNGKSCKHCINQQPSNLNYISNYLSLFKYNALFSSIIKEAKFNGAFRLFIALTQLNFRRVTYFLSQIINKEGNQQHKVTLIPIPLHKYKERKRGFNQSLKIAQNIFDNLPLKMQANCEINHNKILSRTKQTKQQSRLRMNRRIQNMENAFIVNVKELKKYRKNTFILIDDIATSGATLNNAAEVLYNGIEQVNSNNKICAIALFDSQKRVINSDSKESLKT